METKELAGALLIAAGLLLGGVIDLGARRFGISTPGLILERPSQEQVAASEPAEQGLDPQAHMGPASGGNAKVPRAVAGRPARLAPIDLNRATSRELEAIDGIGPALASRIIALRDTRGGYFRSFDELLDVRGIGPAKLERLRASSVISQPPAPSQNSALRKSTSTQADSSGLHR